MRLNSKLSYRLAALVAGVAMQTGVVHAVEAKPQGVGGVTAPVPDNAPQVAAGPGTQAAYTARQLAALGRHAGGRMLVLSAADAAFLAPDTATPGQDPLDKLLPSWMSRLDARVRDLVQASVDAGAPRTIPLTAAGSNELTAPPVAAILIVPTPQQLTEDYYRRQTGVAFPPGVMSPAMLQEGALYIAAHEASHWRLFQLAERSDGKIRNSEYGAETGAQEFVRNNPAFFPHLRDSTAARAMLLGRRAINLITSGGSDDGHHYTAYLKPTDRTPERDRQQQLVDANRDMSRLIATALYDAGQLQPEPADAFRAALGRVTQPWAYTLSSDKAHGVKFDPAADKTGLLQPYLRQTRQEKTDAESALSRFAQTLQPLLDGDPSPDQKAEASQFMQRYNITPTALDRFVQSGMRLAAPDALGRVQYDLAKPASLDWSIAPGSRPYMLPAQTQQLCADGTTGCSDPERLLLPTHPLIQNTLAAVQRLQKSGAFARNPTLQAFADNLMAGATFYRVVDQGTSAPAVQQQANRRQRPGF